jgi:uncharacterized protein
MSCKCGGCCVACKVVGLLVVIGAINWGLVGIFQFDLVARIFGAMTTSARIVYGLIGIAGVAKLVSCIKACPCNKQEKEGCCETKK